MTSKIQSYLNTPHNARNFAEGVALLEQAIGDVIQVKALKKYINKSYINRQIWLSLTIALQKHVESQTQRKTPTVSVIIEKNVATTTQKQASAPASLFAIREDDPDVIKKMITDTGRMTDEAFAARNALFYLKSDADRYEYAMKAVQLYRKAAEQWRKIKVFRESGTLPPELVMTISDLKKEVLAKIEQRKYIIERTYRLQSWLDNPAKAPPMSKSANGEMLPEWVEKYKKEIETKIEELDKINEWLHKE